MKHILLVVATDSEFEAVSSALNLTKNHDLIDSYIGILNDKKITVIKSGIGKGAMCFALGFMLAKEHYDLVINTGVAGGLYKRVKPLTTIIATECAYYDVDLRGIEPDLKLGQLDDMPQFFKPDETVIKKSVKTGLIPGIIVSGDLFITNKNTPNNLDENFNKPIAIDMESAAVGEACYIANIPFAVIRTISDDTTNDENGNDYYQSLSDTCRAAVLKTLEIIKQY